MSSYEPSANFNEAAAYLSHATALSNVSNTVKLELYGLFKCLTASFTPTTSRPGLLDFAGRAKWDSWNRTGQSYAGRAAEAEQRYLAIARELGWKEGSGDTVIAAAPESSTPRAQDSDGIWDDDAPTARQGGGGSGLGVSVSTMAPEATTEREHGSLHSLALAGDADRVKTYLQIHSGSDINETDEFGYTPLHLACDRGHKAVVELLLQAGADISIQDQDEFTAVELARVAEHNDIVELLEKS